MGNSEILLVRKDGALILQHRDDKPGIANPGLITTFGGHIEAGETPLDAAVRELGEETNLKIRPEQLEFFGKYHKTKEVHGEDWDVYYYILSDVDDAGLQVYEGQGFVIAKNEAAAKMLHTSLLLRELLTDFFASRR
jgi:8-oxo-dGTP pyrophosphatase MutT (NUDIX family)